MLRIDACPVADLIAAAAFPQLAAEYARESLIDGMPAPAPDWTAYRALDAAGLLHGFAASIDGELVGFIAVLVSTLPRCGRLIAVLAEGSFRLGLATKAPSGRAFPRQIESGHRARGVAQPRPRRSCVRPVLDHALSRHDTRSVKADSSNFMVSEPAS